jgi:hypothetical protein
MEYLTTEPTIIYLATDSEWASDGSWLCTTFSYKGHDDKNFFYITSNISEHIRERVLSYCLNNNMKVFFEEMKDDLCLLGKVLSDEFK